MRAAGLLHRGLPPRAVVAPPIDRRARIWDGPCRVMTEAGGVPKYWLLGAHGGAGVSTLAWLLPHAADCRRWWPVPVPGEAPFTVLVARETVSGLASADALLRQHHAGLAGDCRIVGMVTVAARPGRTPTVIRRDLRLYSALVERWWRIGWHENFIQQPLLTPSRSAAPDVESDSTPGDIAMVGREVLAVIEDLSAGTRPTETRAAYREVTKSQDTGATDAVPDEGRS